MGWFSCKNNYNTKTIKTLHRNKTCAIISMNTKSEMNVVVGFRHFWSLSCALNYSFIYHNVSWSKSDYILGSLPVQLSAFQTVSCLCNRRLLPVRQFPIRRLSECCLPVQGGRAQHDFSLAWLEAALIFQWKWTRPDLKLALRRQEF